MKAPMVGPGGHRWGAVVVALILGCFLSFAVVLSAVNSLGEDRELPRVPFADMIGAARLSELRFEHALRAGTVSPSMVRRAKEASRTVPLSAEPFLFAAMQYFPTKESLGSQRAMPLLREALRRDPRSRAAHFLLLRRALADGDVESALHHLSRLKQLEPDLVEQMMRMVGGQIKTVDAAKEVASGLFDHRDLIDGITIGVAGGDAPGEVVLRFAEALPGDALVGTEAGSALVNRLIKEDYYSEARAIWAVMNRAPPALGRGLVYDPTFREKRSRPPFGWSFVEDETGLSEWRGRGSVYLEYYGRRSGPLLSQTLTLPAGSYFLRINASEEGQQASTIAAQISCVGGERTLVVVPIIERTPSDPSHARFKIPRDCPDQVLEIVGLPNEDRAGGAIMLHRFAVEHSGSSK